MDDTIYINLDTYEKTEGVPNYIHCDKEIADVIIELNKKGYETVASCAGHNESGSTGYYQLPLKDYEEWIKEFGNHKSVVRTEIYDDQHFICISKHLITTVYVAFKNIYEFADLPAGFTTDELGDKTSLSCRIYYYEDEAEETWQKMKTQKQIDDEINDARARLLAWAKELKPVKEKGMNK